MILHDKTRRIHTTEKRTNNERSENGPDAGPNSVLMHIANIC